MDRGWMTIDYGRSLSLSINIYQFCFYRISGLLSAAPLTTMHRHTHNQKIFPVLSSVLVSQVPFTILTVRSLILFPRPIDYRVKLNRGDPYAFRQYV